MSSDRTARDGETSVTVAKAARTVGLSPSALRYYESEGVLSPSSKSGAGYRLYDRAALDRLTAPEKEAFKMCLAENIRLEQERIPHEDVLAVLGA